MITVSNVSLTFGGQKLFSGADLKFMPGNCYGVIGANGAGKSTFLRILSGELEPTTGTVTIPAGQRLSTLKQDQFKYDAYPVLDTVIMGNQRLYDIMKEKDELYAKPDFSDADGERAAELEGEFAEMDGWNAESDAATLLTGLGLPVEMHTMLMGDLKGGEKFKVLLAQALFGVLEAVYKVCAHDFQLIRYFAVDPKQLPDYEKYVKKPIQLRAILVGAVGATDA